jgi:alpha-mannosidase
MSAPHDRLVVHMIGNAHIDPIWLWRWPAGVDEALSTFRSAADRCDEFPEFVFTRGEAWLYRWVDRLEPELGARVDALIARGQWHVTGSMVVQPDANLPTTEGWRRQLRHGRRWLHERFGVSPTVAYNVDSFGHPASLPDLLAQEGMDAYVFHRPHPAQVALPAPLFRWRGTGGAEVLGFRIVPGYVTRTEDLAEQVRTAIAEADPAVGHTMCFYGVGNHGGGPTRANVEWILAHRSFEGAELRFSTPAACFAAVRERFEALPVVDLELQRTFPGCYSVMQGVKARQRRAELALAGAEAGLPPLAEDPGALAARLDALWDDLLFCQFHDVLAGTSIPSAWAAVRDLQGRAAIGTEEAVVEATRRWAARAVAPAPFAQLVVVNADPAPWTGLVEAEPSLDFSPWGERWLSDAEGRRLPVQLVQPEAQALTTRVLYPVGLAPGEAMRILVRDDPAPPAPAGGPVASASPAGLANGPLAVDLRPGGIAALRLDGRHLLGAEGIALHLRADASDTWTWDLDHFPEPVLERLGGDWAVEEAGPLRARVHLDAVLGDSHVRLALSLAAGEPRLDLELDVLWAERHRLLQLAIDLPAPPAAWTDAQPGGTVRRTPSRTEHPVGGWSRVPAGDAQLALVTPDASSLSVDGARWQWTLLRAPRMAWGGGPPQVAAGREAYADHGARSFALELHAGPGLPSGRLDDALRRMAWPPVVLERFAGMERRAPGSWPVLFSPIERRREA